MMSSCFQGGPEGDNQTRYVTQLEGSPRQHMNNDSQVTHLSSRSVALTVTGRRLENNSSVILVHEN